MDDPEAEYTEYVRGRIPALRRLAFLLCGDEHRADDLVQTTITNLYVHWSKAQHVSHLNNYVRTMLVRAFIDERRLKWARVRLFGSLPEPDPVPGPAEGGVEDRAVLRAALAKVPRRQQAVLVLRFLCDLPVDEVAEILNCSAGTVKSQTSYGLARLRKLLDEQKAQPVTPKVRH
jgi:RNA polymerase sigma-70 factor (sigma-E family)